MVLPAGSCHCPVIVFINHPSIMADRERTLHAGFLAGEYPAPSEYPAAIWRLPMARVDLRRGLMPWHIPRNAAHNQDHPAKATRFVTTRFSLIPCADKSR